MSGKRTWSYRELQRQARREERKGESAASVPPYERPKTRGDCVNGFRPCPYVGCKYHLLLEQTHSKQTPGILMTFGCSTEVEDALDIMPETCALDVADRGGVTLDVVGRYINITRERVRQVEEKALAKLSLSSDAQAVGPPEGEIQKKRRRL